MSDDRAGRSRSSQGNLVDQATAAREQRRAEEAARAAKQEAYLARMEAEARAVEEARRALDEQRLKREAERRRLEAEADKLVHEETHVAETELRKREEEMRQHLERQQLEEERQRISEERVRVSEERERVSEEHRRMKEESQRLSEESRRLSERTAAEQRRIDEAARELQVYRELLQAEGARLAAERAQVQAAAAAELEREAALRLAEQQIEQARLRLEADTRARAEAERREIDEIDRRLEERGALAQAAAPVAPEGLRRKARLRVSASALIDHGGGVIALPFINVSLTGGLIATQGHDLSALEIGSTLLVTLVDNDQADRQADLVSRIVRHGEGSVAVDWSEDARSAHSMARLLDSLSEPLAQQPALEIRQSEIAEVELRLEERAAAEAPQADEPPAVLSSPRRKARVQLSASVLVDHGGATDILQVVNVSLTGALILTQGTVLGRLRVGSLLLLALVASDDQRRVDLLARVVRRDGDATAVDWSQDQAAAYDVAVLLDALAKANDGDA